jgi:hypothetical protein
VEVGECVFAAFLVEDVECVVEECVEEWEDLCVVDELPVSPPPPPSSNSQSPCIIPALADAK